MVIRGLERYGYRDLAREIATNHLTNMAAVFEKTGTVWENYVPDKMQPGQLDGRQVGRNFVGWCGIGPILYLLEYRVGLKSFAPKNELCWELRSTNRVGCDRYRFAGHVADLVATPDNDRWRIHIASDGDFHTQGHRRRAGKDIRGKERHERVRSRRAIISPVAQAPTAFVGLQRRSAFDFDECKNSPHIVSIVADHPLPRRDMAAWPSRSVACGD